MTHDEFLRTIKPMVIADMKKTGILCSLTGAQAIIESNWGNSGLAVKGNNLFGIKGSYNGQSITMPTTEYYGGQPYKVNADFRKYPSWLESIADHSAMFNRMKRYANLRNCTDWKQATINVKEDGYATSPTYTQTLQNTIQKYKLYEWDNEVLYGQPKDTGNPYTEPTNNIKYGSKGEGVKWVQRALNNNGYHLVEDGICGQLTVLAIRDYQERNSLVVDGIAGRKTREKLKA